MAQIRVSELREVGQGLPSMALGLTDFYSGRNICPSAGHAVCAVTSTASVVTQSHLGTKTKQIIIIIIIIIIIKIKIISVVYSSQGSHTGQLDFCN